MKKSELQERFRRMLEQRKELLVKAVKQKNKPSALMMYGQICGVSASMKQIGLIDNSQMEWIQAEAWTLYQGKDVEHEAC